MKKIMYTEEQIRSIKGLLNSITISGLHNARQLAVVAQILDSGIPSEEEPDNKKGEG